MGLIAKQAVPLTRRTHRAVAAGLLTVALVGCSGDAAYQELQSAIKSHITDKDRRPVKSVACAPHVNGTVRGETAHLRCLVTFTDGTYYDAAATIQNENTGGTHNLPDRYSWDAPPSPAAVRRAMP